MRQLSAMLTTLSNRVDGLVTKLVLLLVSLMTVIITLQIIMRVFFTALSWTEEASRYLLVWSTFFGASMALKRGAHISVTFVRDLLPKRAGQFLSMLSSGLMIFFMGIVIRYGIKLIVFQTSQTSPALRLPMSIVYISIPLGLTVMLVHSLAVLASQISASNGVKQA